MTVGLSTELDSENNEACIAVISGKPLTEVPSDLFIPPDALKVLLESFSGPLDLLWYLIKKQHIDVLNIPIALITQQYIEYIQWIEAARLELAADYLVMAAMLAEIKSRCLLPIHSSEESECEEDPRLALVRKLQTYEAMRVAANQIDAMPRECRDFYHISIALAPSSAETSSYPLVEIDMLYQKMVTLLKRNINFENHSISAEKISIQDRMSKILDVIHHTDSPVPFFHLLQLQEGRAGVVVTFLAILELAKQCLIQIIQPTSYSPIYLEGVERV